MTEIDVTEKDAATAHVGDTLVVRLAETPSTGFTWTVEVTGTGVSVARDTQAGDPEPRPGAAGQRVMCR
jgi:predicted secreted protein